MSAPIRIQEPGRRGSLAELEKQHGAVVDALDRLFMHEIPAGDQRPPALRLVWPEGEAIDRDLTGEGLRAFIVRRGWDLWTIGGEPELFASFRAIMAARPNQQMWNRTQLAALWGDIGEHGPGRR